jgi:gamma-glutamylputrescine oxidase
LRLSDSPANSYYRATLAAVPAHPPLRGEICVDVGVVGAGIAGCSAALHLAERGFSVALLEAREIGFGASGRSGGQTIFGLAASQQAVCNAVGAQDARAIFDMSVEGLDQLQALINKHSIDCDYRPGHLHAAVRQKHIVELRAWENELRGEYGYDSISFVERRDLGAHVASERYLAGLLDTRSGHLHPLKYVRGLARAAETAGVKIFEDSRVERYRDGATIHVDTAQGRLRCQQLVLCGSAYLGAVAPTIAKRILGVGTYMIASEPMSAERAAAIMPSRAAIADMNWILDYFRLSADHRLLFGGRVSYSAVDPPHLVESMRRRMVAAMPALAGLKVDFAWGGYLDITMSRLPNFGRLAANVFYLQGFSGHGMALTGLGGKLVAEAIAASAERFDVFARIPHRNFPGGALLRRPALMLAMLYFRLRDLL